MPIVRSSAPYALKDPKEREIRRRQFKAKHMLPLTRLVAALRQHHGGSARQIPDVDPCDGGITARALFVLERPGPRAIEAGFISRDNHDPTAGNMLKLLDAAGMRRQDTVLWNVVPWAKHGGVTVPTPDERNVGIRYLLQLLRRLPRLRFVVLIGHQAQMAHSAIQLWCSARRIALLHAPHPSGRVFSTQPQKEQEALRVFRHVATALRSGAR